MPQGFLSQSNHKHLLQVLWVADYVYIAEVWIKKEAGGGDGGNVILLIVGEWSRRRFQISYRNRQECKIRGCQTVTPSLIPTQHSQHGAW